MFAKNKVSQSLVDAVSSIVNEAEKVPTTTGMKVYGSSYGNSQKARKDQLKSTLADVKGPSKSDIEKEKEVKEELKGNQHKIDKNKNNKIDAEDFKMLRKEELKGNQHKIDANKNNKIDAHDFQLLRGKKKVKEDTFVDKLFNSLSESEEIRRAINEVMKRDASAGDWIHDFLHSDNPKFDGKSKAERKKMALAAYYSMKKRSRNESVEDLEMTKVSDEAEDTAARKSIKAKDTEKSQKIINFDKKYGTPNAFDEEVELDEGRGFPVPTGDTPASAAAGAAIAAHLDSKKSAEDRHLAAWKKSEHAPNDNDRATDENPQIGGDLHAIHKSAVKYMKTVKEPNPTTHSRFGSGTHFGDLAWAIAHRFHKERLTKTRLDNSFELNGFELNEVSKSEVDHHYDKWTTSDSAPDHHDAGDDPKIHKSALKYLRSTDVPKENHEKLAMHIANKFHGSGIDEAAPKKMDDVAKQNLTPAKKGVVGTVKSDFKNFKSFLAGKKETNEEVESLDEDMALFEAEQLFLESSPQEVVSTIQKIRKDVPKDAKEVHQHLDKAEEHFKSGNKMRGLFHATKFFLAARKYNMKEEVDSSNQTIDTLAGRSKKVPKEAKIDNAHSSAKVALKAEEVESLDEDNYLNKFLSSRGINPKFVSRNTKVAHAKSNEYKTWLRNHRDMDGYKMSEASDVPFDGPYTNTKKNVKDKSGAVHTPMSRAKDLAQQAMQRVKKDLK
jgi:hypothetical protein